MEHVLQDPMAVGSAGAADGNAGVIATQLCAARRFLELPCLNQNNGKLTHTLGYL